MKNVAIPAASLLLLVNTWLRPESEPVPARTLPAAAMPIDDSSCQICHPGPTAALRRGPHAYLLLDGPHRASSCTVCHGDAAEHLRTALDPDTATVPAGAVAAAACASCHADDDYPTSRGSHSWSRQPAQPQAELSETAVAPPEKEPMFLGLDWAALWTAGYRFVDRDGSTNRYKTDVNLDSGFRLTEAEIEGRGDGTRWADFVRFSASSIADPYQQLEGLVEKDGSYRARAGFTKTKVTYRADGEYHRVDRNSDETSFDLSLDVADDVQLFGSFTRFNQDGFWLTNRVGNLNVTPLTTVAGVESPGNYNSDVSEVGLSGVWLDTSWLVAFNYRGDSQDDRWTYDRASPINPAFNESDDFSSHSSLRGPGMRFAAARTFEALSIDVSGLVLDLDRNVTGEGVSSGFDTSEFSTTSDSDAAGHARTWVVETSVSLELSERVALVGDMRLVGHQEDFTVLQTDTIFRPSLGTTTSVTSLLDLSTSQQTFEGSVQLDVEPTEGLLLSGGYGWAREDLTIPDLEVGDDDFTSGLLRSDGFLAGFEWRPDGHWLIGAEHRQFGQNGPQLYNIVADSSEGTKARIRYTGDRFWLETFYQRKQRENDIALMHYEGHTTGVTGSVQPHDALDIHASWVWNDIDSRTLTNFYFDPDPNPIPTYVGFHGTTYTVTAGVGVTPDERVRWRFDGALTDTNGSFDVRLLDWQSDLSVKVFEGGEAGVLFRYLDYTQQGAGDDYDAALTLVYWRQRLGG